MSLRYTWVKSKDWGRNEGVQGEDNVVEMIAEDGCKEQCSCINNVHVI